MATISLELIQQLRERTGLGMMDCKKALQESEGDIEKAIEILRKKGSLVAAKRAGNATKEGLVHAYIHPGSRVGVLIDINCETDFVARNEAMAKFAQDVCLHIAALNPRYVSPEEADQNFIAKEREIFTEQLIAEKKPAHIIEQIVQGKINKIVNDVSLLKQPFVKNDAVTVDDVLKELIAKMGENIKIRRFVRYEVGA